MDVRAARPLYGMKRGKALEILTCGVVGVTRDGIMEASPLGDVKMVSRSILKPWQFLAADVFTDEDFWAIGIASSSGQAIHLEALAALKEVTGGDETTLVCAATYPFDSEEAARLRVNGRPQSKLYHFCCGKHLTLHYACRQNGWDPSTYHQLDNPVQQRLVKLIEDIVGERVEWMVDSCGLPTLYAPLRCHLKLWAELGGSKDPRKLQMKELWLRNSRLVGGYNRLDSDIVEVSDYRVLAKEGADGVLAVQTVSERNEKQMGIIIKLTQGFTERDMGLALWTELNARRDILPDAFKSILDFLEERKRTRWIKSDQIYVSPAELSST